MYVNTLNMLMSGLFFLCNVIYLTFIDIWKHHVASVTHLKCLFVARVIPAVADRGSPEFMPFPGHMWRGSQHGPMLPKLNSTLNLNM